MVIPCKKEKDFSVACEKCSSTGNVCFTLQKLGPDTMYVKGRREKGKTEMKRNGRNIGKREGKRGKKRIAKVF